MARALRKSELRTSKSEIRNQKSEISVQKRSTLELDRLIHERLRLGIISALAVNDHMVFSVPWLDGPIALAAAWITERHALTSDVDHSDSRDREG